MTDTAINLKSCPPEELASWLLANRFEVSLVMCSAELMVDGCAIPLFWLCLFRGLMLWMLLPSCCY